MTETAPVIAPGDVPPELVERVKPTLDALVDRITTRIQRDVEGFAGPAAGRRSKLISNATTGAISHFLDVALGVPSSTGPKVDEMFRRMGYAEALDGRELSDLREALRIAGREAWTELRTVASAHALSAELVGKLGDELFGYVFHLIAQAETGYDTGVRASDADDAHGVRARLLDAILTYASDAEREALAEKASWTVPQRVVVVTTVLSDQTAPPEPPSEALLRIDADYATYMCAEEHSDAVIDSLHTAAPELRLGVGWPTDLADAADSHRWTVRLLDLAERGIVPDEQILYSADHRTQLWLHAEPALRRQLAQELLLPLLSESPNSREILSETLLVWLQTRDSAPVIAARLGVHAQTVRYRWKRINELFGDALHDPEYIMQLTLVLKASVPLWVAGDQSDFERYREDQT